MTAYECLAEEFNRRQMRNKHYSLRAFARDIGVSAPFLSQFLSGKRGISLEKAKSILQKIEWPEEQKDLFCSLIEKSLVKKLNITTMIQQNMDSKFEALKIKESEFRLIANWYYYAILELTSVKGFKSEVQWISDRLKISPKQTVEALDRLMKLKLLEYKRGRYQRKTKHYQIKDISSLAIREHHHQSLDLAHRAIDEQALEKREFGSSTMAINSEDLPAIKEKIKKFREKIIKEYSVENGNAIYKLSTQLFELGSSSTEPAQS